MADRTLFAWMTARRIKPGRMDDFQERWCAAPQGSLGDPYSGAEAMYFLHDASGDERMIGLSTFVSRQAYERWRASLAEQERNLAMEPLVEQLEWERFFWLSDFSPQTAGGGGPEEKETAGSESRGVGRRTGGSLLGGSGLE